MGAGKPACMSVGRLVRGIAHLQALQQLELQYDWWHQYKAAASGFVAAGWPSSSLPALEQLSLHSMPGSMVQEAADVISRLLSLTQLSLEVNSGWGAEPASSEAMELLEALARGIAALPQLRVLCLVELCGSGALGENWHAVSLLAGITGTSSLTLRETGLTDESVHTLFAASSGWTSLRRLHVDLSGN